MDVRKLVSFGNSSFVISLPKAWIIKNGLKKGDILRIEERPFELIVSAKEDNKKKLTETIRQQPGLAFPITSRLPVPCVGHGLTAIRSWVLDVKLLKHGSHFLKACQSFFLLIQTL